MGCYQDSFSASLSLAFLSALRHVPLTWQYGHGRFWAYVQSLYQCHQKRRTFSPSGSKKGSSMEPALVLTAPLGHQPILYSYNVLSGQARVTCLLLRHPHGPRVGGGLSLERTGLPLPKEEGKNAGQAMPATNR